MKKGIYIIALFFAIGSPVHAQRNGAETELVDAYFIKAAQLLKRQTLREAKQALRRKPITITAFKASRSAGGINDFYSEGDYWWPDPEEPDGPYIQRDGLSNPDNFVEHRLALIRFSEIIGTLASAYKLTGNHKYVRAAIPHLKAWFVDAGTRMNPSLLYAQAIKGRFTGRGIGIIDTIHLMEVAQGILTMQAHIEPAELERIKGWFEAYLDWLMTHPYGEAEMNAKNNHGTCFVMQVAAFASLTNDGKRLSFCRERFKQVLLPDQMASDGSFPREINRTKPYGYSLFNLDAMAMICQILSSPEDNLWDYTTSDGRSIENGIAYLFPFVDDKSKWPFPQDVMYWDNWPVAQPFLFFGARAYENDAWLAAWSRLDHKPSEEEVIRNLPIRHPLIWIN
ncbi:MAG TPA: alginate lyase family protein [Parapedobacter sp.]|uniref:alginate lyase family protein n=1 Tax=Parapedobacter sp. TaxID=1958893 RepID=UPI002C7A1CC1|nr:alginate lyase family protein [Parapedobacter sp.]HWK57651.1 alginate lyase family protein [Parapedobacter sp.]